MAVCFWFRQLSQKSSLVKFPISYLQTYSRNHPLSSVLFCCTECSKAQKHTKAAHSKHSTIRFYSDQKPPFSLKDKPSTTTAQEEEGEGKGETRKSPSKRDLSSSSRAQSSNSKDNISTIVKVKQTVKSFKTRRPSTDLNKPYTANIFITPLRAMDEYLLGPQDLERLPKTKRRSPYPELDDITVYLRKDIEEKAIEKWGSMEALHKERLNLLSTDPHYRNQITRWGRLPPHYVLMKEDPPPGVFKSGPGRVVLYAIFVNTFNTVLKLIAWLYTGSHSMFSEFIHSLADTMNQCILAFGIQQSHKKADLEHPYGWTSFRNISSLISGVGIFCVGSGLSAYHGIMGLAHPEPFHNLFWAAAILAGSFISESATLMVATIEVRKSAKDTGLSFFKYIWSNRDPMSIVVLLEDAAAVLGVSIAASCMLLSHYLSSPIPDACGSLIIASLLGGVASFIVYANTVSLVGRSIPPEKKQELMKELETDRMIRALHDVKATDMGSTYVRFKAEVDFDGRELTRLYLEGQDMERILKEMQGLETMEQVEAFLLKHGEAIVDTMGAEVDRIERNLKARHPELRHVDLEQL